MQPIRRPRNACPQAGPDRARHSSSQHGDHGTVPYSELAMHTRIAGLAVQRYALFTDSANPERGIIWAQVFTDQGMTDGLPSEVLPWPVRHQHGI